MARQRKDSLEVCENKLIETERTLEKAKAALEKAKATVKDIEKQKKDLCDLQRNLKMKELSELVDESGLTLEQLKALIITHISSNKVDE